MSRLAQGRRPPRMCCGLRPPKHPSDQRQFRMFHGSASKGLLDGVAQGSLLVLRWGGYPWQRVREEDHEP